MDLLDLQQSTLVLSTLLLIDTFKATNMLAASTPLLLPLPRDICLFLFLVISLFQFPKSPLCMAFTSRRSQPFIALHTYRIAI